MKRIIIAVALLATVSIANVPICTASEYAKKDCQTVYVNGKAGVMCRWICLPLVGAGR